MGGAVCRCAAEAKGGTIKAAALATGATGGSYSLVVWLPTYLKAVRHMSVIGTTAFTTVLIAGSFTGFLAGAYRCDAIGRRRTFMVSMIGSASIRARLPRVQDVLADGTL